MRRTPSSIFYILQGLFNQLFNVCNKQQSTEWRQCAALAQLTCIKVDDGNLTKHYDWPN